jgi:hypothetical protein
VRQRGLTSVRRRDPAATARTRRIRHAVGRPVSRRRAAARHRGRGWPAEHAAQSLHRVAADPKRKARAQAAYAHASAGSRRGRTRREQHLGCGGSSRRPTTGGCERPGRSRSGVTRSTPSPLRCRATTSPAPVWGPAASWSPRSSPCCCWRRWQDDCAVFFNPPGPAATALTRSPDVCPRAALVRTDRVALLGAHTCSTTKPRGVRRRTVGASRIVRPLFWSRHVCEVRTRCRCVGRRHGGRCWLWWLRRYQATTGSDRVVGAIPR